MSDGNTVWVTGNKGFVGGVMDMGLRQAGFNVVGTDAELSVCEPERLEAFAEEVQPDFIVNCAGIRREEATLGNKVKAYEVNALGAHNMAVVANTVGATIVQVSSDDVFAPVQPAPVNEFDVPNAITPYGKSKLAGEYMVRSTTPDHIILRSSWLYRFGAGKMKKLLEDAKTGGKYEVRTDQYAAPASMKLYIHYLVKMMEKGAKGTYHITPLGRASRYDLMAKTLELAGYNPEDVLIPTSDPETPEDIVLESLMLEMAGATLPTWEEDLASYMEIMGLLKN